MCARSFGLTPPPVRQGLTALGWLISRRPKERALLWLLLRFGAHPSPQVVSAAIAAVADGRSDGRWVHGWLAGLGWLAGADRPF